MKFVSESSNIDTDRPSKQNVQENIPMFRKSLCILSHLNVSEISISLYNISCLQVNIKRYRFSSPVLRSELEGCSLALWYRRYRKKGRRTDGEREEGREMKCGVHMLIDNRCTG